MKTPFANIIVLLLVLVSLPLSTQAQESQSSHSVRVEIPELGILNVIGPQHLDINLSECLEGLEPGQNIVYNICEGQECEVWLNYTSIKGSGANSLKAITIEMQGNLPNGIHLIANVNNPAGQSTGATGASVATEGLHITQTPQNVIEGIGTGWTGVGAGNGVFVNYGLEIHPDAEAMEGNYAVDITYTMKNI
jgi:hypothetical protein